jgi:hypothetical protein
VKSGEDESSFAVAINHVSLSRSPAPVHRVHASATCDYLVEPEPAKTLADMRDLVTGVATAADQAGLSQDRNYILVAGIVISREALRCIRI